MQLTQLVAPTVIEEYVPKPQLVQETAPASDEYMPDSQLVQLDGSVSPILASSLPATHDVQLDDAFAEA